MILRDYIDTDFKEVLDIEKESFIHPWTEEQLEYELKNNPIREMIVAVEENRVIGFINAWITFETSSIAQIAVASSNRRNGVATKMFEEMERRLIEKKCEYITLEVRKSNERAINFYKKIGFREIVIKPKYYDNGEDAIYMVKDIIYGNNISY